MLFRRDPNRLPAVRRRSDQFVADKYIDELLGLTSWGDVLEDLSVRRRERSGLFLSAREDILPVRLEFPSLCPSVFMEVFRFPPTN